MPKYGYAHGNERLSVHRSKFGDLGNQYYGVYGDPRVKVGAPKYGYADGDGSLILDPATSAADDALRSQLQPAVSTGEVSKEQAESIRN